MSPRKEMDVSDLYALLESLSRHIDRRIDLYALGGTALTILGIKSSTLDIDFNTSSISQYNYLIDLFERIGFTHLGGMRWRTQEGIGLDIFRGTDILGTHLLEDALRRSKKIRRFGELTLFTLSPLDIIISKLARGDSRDFSDIRQIIEASEIDLPALVARYKETMGISVVADHKQKLLDLIDLKFNEWGFTQDQDLIDEVRRWDG